MKACQLTRTKIQNKQKKKKKESTQMVTTKPDFLRIRFNRLERLDKYDRLG